MDGFEILFASLKRATVDSLGKLAEVGRLVGEVATLREDLLSVDVVCFVHTIIMAQKWGFCNPLCASSVVGPRGRDAAVGTGCEAGVLNGLNLATVCWGAVERRFNGVDSVAIAIDALN